MTNHPVELSDLVTDSEGNQVFHENHPCVDGFEKDLEPRREHDGHCYKTFHVDFETDQDPQFLRINDTLNGFDVLRGKCLNCENELRHFKMLQIMTKEKDKDERREGEASHVNCETTLRSMKGQQSKRENSPFSTTVPRPDPASSSGPTAEHEWQVAESQARLESALKLAETEQAAAQRAEMAAIEAKVKEEAAVREARAKFESLWQAEAQHREAAQRALRLTMHFSRSFHWGACEMNVSFEACVSQAKSL
jgi:hypothetical protein